MYASIWERAWIKRRVRVENELTIDSVSRQQFFYVIPKKLFMTVNALSLRSFFNLPLSLSFTKGDPFLSPEKFLLANWMNTENILHSFGWLLPCFFSSPSPKRAADTAGYIFFHYISASDLAISLSQKARNKQNGIRSDRAILLFSPSRERHSGWRGIWLTQASLSLSLFHPLPLSQLSFYLPTLSACLVRPPVPVRLCLITLCARATLLQLVSETEVRRDENGNALAPA